MITPEILLKSFDSYRRGDKKFCKLASVSGKNDGMKKHLGFWIEVIRKDKKLVLLVQVESLTGNESEHTTILFSKEHLETLVEEARLFTSKELEAFLCAAPSCIKA